MSVDDPQRQLVARLQHSAERAAILTYKYLISYSITSSGVARSDVANCNAEALTVLRLMTSSKLAATGSAALPVVAL